MKLLNLEGTAQRLPISYIEAALVASAETIGGLLALMGGFRQDGLSDLATRLGAALNLPVMIGAISIVHWGLWNFMPSESHPMGGFEFPAALILIMLYFVFTGIRGSAASNAANTQSA